MSFNATWRPGPDAVAGMRVLGMASNSAGLVIYLHPDSLAIAPPADPARWPEFVRLMREIRDGADELARFIDQGDSLARGSFGGQ
ncbi:hypothetical protein EV191_1011449 [Tamaricihabitans halophyticus]|uniref:Uncharacterized protein n=1 Tax=Tamaricihabitans halophyticus TaxID=1262583 RepID=A0A4R2R3S3_9PSEU|nr:hypothetical protein [Tamaricihabitans halophyticus]TCP57492.1 hypothetical protein EV191_1011449 [Tamaricihabitans halophyticus]